MSSIEISPAEPVHLGVEGLADKDQARQNGRVPARGIDMGDPLFFDDQVHEREDSGRFPDDYFEGFNFTGANLAGESPSPSPSPRGERVDI